jgi:hypothetical protein
MHLHQIQRSRPPDPKVAKVLPMFTPFCVSENPLTSFGLVLVISDRTATIGYGRLEIRRFEQTTMHIDQ